MKSFMLPDLGEGLQEAEIVAWHVGEGDHVVADQPLLSVETDKAVVEIPSPRSGRIARLHATPGAILPIGAALVDFDEGGEDRGAIVGELVRDTPRPRAPGGQRREIRAAPAVRRRAEELGVDLATVVATGPEGTVSRADVEKAAELRPGGAEPLRGVRRAMARNMARAHVVVVPATVNDEADIGAWGRDSDVTTRLVRAIGTACAAEPALNAHLVDEGENRVLHRSVDLGIAMDTQDGLFVPVLHDVASRSREDLRRGLERMKEAVRTRTVPREELVGATITLSNFGMFGGRHAQLVVLPPQVAILGAGRLREDVRVQDGAIRVTRLLPLSLTFDHRAVMGGEAARFMAAVIADLEQPG
ncbi:dihydrolipoamide acetyltransferase family protein [Geminicoccaceae bacterium 1502E]|nr:dihydrolipoamide acetyltransferase family protein [Geminicoccaceae bacterium 1502E]